LAICWELLYDNFYISQSAGNHLTLWLNGILRDPTPESVFCKIELVNFSLLGFISTKCLNDKRFYIPEEMSLSYENNLEKYNPLFASYLTGLIEGDGTIIVPKTERSPKGELNYPSIQICFDVRDLPLAVMIQKELGFGSISKTKGVNAYRLTINNSAGIIIMVKIISGYMRTPKIVMLNRLIDFLNNKYPSSSFSINEIDNSKLDSNA
jgi:hypothetical protein